jgi:hypothetical protein
MKRRLATLLATTFVMAHTAVAWAGSGAGGGPAGAEGGGGSEPTLIALVVLSMIPAVYFVRRAMAAQPIKIDD